MSRTSARSDERELATAISAAILELDPRTDGRRRTTATTYLDENIVLCVLESNWGEEQDATVAGESCAEVIDRSDALETAARAEFTRAVERLTHRHVRASKSSRTRAGVAYELFLLDFAALTLVGRALGPPIRIGAR